MAGRPYRALRIILRIFSLVAAVAGPVFIFSGKPLMMRLFLNPPESEVTTFLLLTMKEMGGFALMLSALLFFASRDPNRNVAIIDAVIAGLVVLALTPLISLETLDIRRLYPGYLIWGRSIVRLALAALLFYLRPRETVGGNPEKEANVREGSGRQYELHPGERMPYIPASVKGGEVHWLIWLHGLTQ